MRQLVLKALKSANRPISGQALAEQLGVSRTAVWKHIQGLRLRGYDISGAPKVGYSLQSAPDILIAEDIEESLPPEFTGHVVCVDKVGSTNSAAKDRATAGDFKPVGLMIAEEQTQGRGRFGRTWISPHGGIWMSLVVRPDIPVVAAGRVVIPVAVAVAEAIIEITGLSAKIKWPNDILVNGKKVCGILTEMAAELGSVEYLVIGFGLNVNFPASMLAEGAKAATTLQAEAGHSIDRAALIESIITKTMIALQDLTEGFDAILLRWRELSDTLGRHITLDAGGKAVEGRAVDVDLDGALIMEVPSGERLVFRAGEVTTWQ